MSRDFISANNADLETFFVSCLFHKITVSGKFYVMHIYEAAKGILVQCCFSEINSLTAIYGTGVGDSWSIPKASLNSTVTVIYRGDRAPYWGGYEEFTSYFNNHSHLVAASMRSCYCHTRTPRDRGDITCFFSGSSCSGLYPADFHSDLSCCIITKFNFVNNSDSSGYFRLVYENVETIIEESVFVFASTSVKWIYSPNSGSGVKILNTFVIANNLPQADQYVSTVNVWVVEKASTHKQFRRHPERMECNSIIKVFTHSLSLNLLSSFPILSLITLTITHTLPVASVQ